MQPIILQRFFGQRFINQGTEANGMELSRNGLQRIRDQTHTIEKIRSHTDKESKIFHRSFAQRFFTRRSLTQRLFVVGFFHSKMHHSKIFRQLFTQRFLIKSLLTQRLLKKFSQPKELYHRTLTDRRLLLVCIRNSRG